MRNSWCWEWRSGQVPIPPGGEEDWFEVRVPAPEHDNGGAWLLDITGAATVNLLVAVLEPRPRIVEEVEKTAKTRTVYNTRVVYRDRVYPRYYHSHWIYEPSRYYTVHYHGIWPYRYFIGAWDTRYYDLAFRPYRYHYGPIYRTRPHGHSARRYRSYGNRIGLNAGARARGTAEARRISPELVQLRRNHPRLRPVRQRQEPRRPNASVRRFKEAKRTHPRLRAFHNPQRRSQAPSRVAEPPPAPAARRPSSVSRQRAAPERRSNVRPAPLGDSRSRALRQAAPRPTASARPPTVRRTPPAQHGPARSNVRTRHLRGTAAAQPARRPAAVHRAPPASRTHARTRAFERQPRPNTAPARTAPQTRSVAPRTPRTAPRRANVAPARTQSAAPPVRRAEPSAPPPPSNSRRRVFERR